MLSAHLSSLIISSTLSHQFTIDLFFLCKRGCSVTKSCQDSCNPLDYSLPGSSVHGIFQARILEWVAISFPMGSSQPRDQTHVSSIAGRFFTTEPPGRPFLQPLNSAVEDNKFTEDFQENFIYKNRQWYEFHCHSFLTLLSISEIKF